MSRPSSDAGRHAHPTLTQRRLDRQPGLTEQDLSSDLVHIQAKLAAKRATIRALEAKVHRLEAVLRSGGTWADYQQTEAARAEVRRARAQTGGSRT